MGRNHASPTCKAVRPPTAPPPHHPPPAHGRIPDGSQDQLHHCDHLRPRNVGAAVARVSRGPRCDEDRPTTKWKLTVTPSSDPDAGGLHHDARRRFGSVPLAGDLEAAKHSYAQAVVVQRLPHDTSPETVQALRDKQEQMARGCCEKGFEEAFDRHKGWDPDRSDEEIEEDTADIRRAMQESLTQTPEGIGESLS